MPQLVQQIGDLLQRREEWLACAESCTGGLVCKTLTDVSGSSGWFERGLVTYSNLAKADLLGVPRTVVAIHGAVSEPTVRAMAEGLMRHSPADWGIAVTGIAGPVGGTPAKPVGTVWIAWVHRARRSGPGRARGDGSAMRENLVTSQLFQFPGDREQVRQQSVQAALEGLLQRLKDA
jgi:nicotinamide-nucleotide amidase